MIAVITADIIDSAKKPASEWLGSLREFLDGQGRHPEDWEIYRGDELQLRTSPENALRAAVGLKALMRSTGGLDIRIAIGLGGESFRASRVGESNGTAYQRSGRAFGQLRPQKTRLSVLSGHDKADHVMNLLLRMALQFMDQWTRVSAETVALALSHPEASQQQLAGHLGIRQSAVSQRQARARLDLVEELLMYYRDIYLKQL